MIESASRRFLELLEAHRNALYQIAAQGQSPAIIETALQRGVRSAFREYAQNPGTPGREELVHWLATHITAELGDRKTAVAVPADSAMPADVWARLAAAIQIEAATLGGAEMKEVLAADEAAVKTADARYSTAKRLFVIAQKTLSDRLGTRQTLVRAKSDLAAADAARAAATAKLQALQDMAVIKTPVDGTVIALRTSNGARVAVGNAILILRPDDSIWLAASFYGADAAAIHTGMTGIFTPATGEKPVPVVVRSVFNASSPSGGETVGMVPAEKERQLRDGAYGNVALGGHVEKMVVVPTRALVLDRGQWWVLVKTDEGLQRRKVVLGPARGWGTFIKSGLKSGDNVIVDNAYGLFHHGIAAHYQPPD